MAKQVINLGTAPSGAGGDDRRSAWIKAIANFDELYTLIASAYNKANIIGAVTQSAGVPTGAAMQQVLNGVGAYWKFANGLLISSQRVSLAAGAASWAAGSGVRYAQITGGLPVAFVAQPDLYGQFYENDISGRSAWLTHLSAPTVSTFSAWASAPPTTSGVGAFSFNILAVGRWF
ncbi:hypothetical protein [Pseudomonas laurentiana]